MEGYRRIKGHILKVANEADLRVENTLRELCEKVTPAERSIIEVFIKATALTGQNTILDLLAAIRPGKQTGFTPQR